MDAGVEQSLPAAVQKAGVEKQTASETRAGAGAAKMADGPEAGVPAPKFLQRPPSFSTNAVHAGYDTADCSSHAVVPPITLATSFRQADPVHPQEFLYGRLHNPSRGVVEKSLATLEAARYAVAFGSGTAAVAAVLQLLRPGDHLVASEHLYSGTWVYLTAVTRSQNIEVEFVDASDVNKVVAALKPNTRMVWVESPSNPTMVLVDLAKLSAAVARHNNEKPNQHSDDVGNNEHQHSTSDTKNELPQHCPNHENKVHQHGSNGKKVLLVADNTFLSPYFQHPLSLGMDVVVHSCSKYLNGATDVIMGVACTNDTGLADKLVFQQRAAGAVPSPFDCYLLHRSIRTLPVRMDRHMASALAVAHFLEEHPSVSRVMHPGLPSHPQHQVALRQSYGHSGILSFYLRPDDLSMAKAFLAALRLIVLCASLGGVETLVQLPLTMSHASVPPDVNARVGITAGLVRLSVGLEDVVDIIADLDQALKQASCKLSCLTDLAQALNDASVG